MHNSSSDTDIRQAADPATSGYKSLTNWWMRHMPVHVTILTLAALTGIGAGLIASLLKYLLRLLSIGISDIFPPTSTQSWLLAVPLTGMVLVNLWQRYMSHCNVSHSTGQILDYINGRDNYRIRPGVIWNSVLGCVLTVGAGASAGSEGPCAYSSASLGNNLGRLFSLDNKWLRVMIGVGAGAGIAGIFKSPVGGALYTLEVLQMELTTIPVIALMVACVIASTTAYMISDFTYDVQFTMETPFDPMSLKWVALLGVICGLYSVYYIWSKQSTSKIMLAIKSRWLRVLAAGGFTALMIWLIPVLYGEGDAVMTDLINNDLVNLWRHGPFSHFADSHWLFYLLVIGILLAKGPLVACADDAGVAGTFVPALFAGAFAGTLIGFVLTDLGFDVKVWYLALAGMGAVLASTSGAPLMAMFICCESTNTFQFMPAYLLCTVASYITTRIYHHIGNRISHIDNHNSNNTNNPTS